MALAPNNASEYAKLTLESLAAHNLGDKLSLGGAFGLLHYLDYRPTHDVDAWWMPATTAVEQEKVLAVIEDTLRQFGEVRRRAWGDVRSIELRQEQKTVFSFQIARLAIETHLARISQHRPLEKINDPAQRAAAQQVRAWFSKEFLNVLSD